MVLLGFFDVSFGINNAHALKACMMPMISFMCMHLHLFFKKIDGSATVVAIRQSNPEKDF